MNSVYQKIKDLLDSQKISYKEMHHEPTYTSEESAKARGEDITNDGKAIVMKCGNEFKLFVISAKLRIDSKKIKKIFLTKSVRFATKEELFELTGLVPGSVPPFGKPILNLDLYVDISITKNDRIAFNAGSLTDSIIMSKDDYIRIVDPKVIEFSEEKR